MALTRAVAILSLLFIGLSLASIRAVAGDDLALSPSFALDSGDIRTHVLCPSPSGVSWFASPQAGASLSEVGSNWAQREVHLITGGADEKFLNETNERLNHWLTSVTTDEADRVAVDDALSGRRSPASETDSWARPQSLRVTRFGVIEMGFQIGSGSPTKLSCDMVNGNGGEWDLSKPVAKDLDLRLHHETTIKSLQLQLKW